MLPRGPQIQKVRAEIRQPLFGLGPDIGFQAFANGLAVDLNSAIMMATADVLQQLWHHRERPPFSVSGKAVFPFAFVWAGFRNFVHNLKTRDTKLGYKAKIT
jgi:hypothetical protein